MIKASAILLALTTGCLIPMAPRTAGDPAMGSAPASSASSYEEPAGAPSSVPATYGTPAARPTQPAAPTTVSVTIRSSCSKTVGVFYGDKPGFSSGTRSSVSSNSVSSHTFRVGERMWVLDDRDQPLSDVTVSENTRNLEIHSSCTSISTR